MPESRSVCILLCRPYTCDLTVHAAPSDSSAGVDYNISSLPLPLTLPAGSSNVSFPLTILADSIVEQDEMIDFQLDIPPGAPPGYSIDPMLGSTLITILDNNCEELQIVRPSSNIHA